MTIEALKNLNPNMKIHSVDSPEFSLYGRKIQGIDTAEIIKAAESIKKPESGSAYEPSVESFEALNIAKKITEEIYGELPTQIGYCHGYNDTLNALEWHTASEVNIAVTDLVLILAKREQLSDGCKLNSADTKAFLLKKGDIVEVFATALHYCPCQVSADGFGCIVGLPRGTNTPLEAKPADKLLFRKNKWIIAHEDNADLLEKGIFGGISGENYKVKF